MGAKDSKRSCLSYEDAVKRMSDVELKRVCEAFKRLAGNNSLLNKHAFIQNVLGDGVPATIAEWLYTACGGGPRGIILRDLICGLVLLTKGNEEEKIRFLWTLYCNDAGTFIVRSEFQNALQIEGSIPNTGNNNGRFDNTLISLFGKELQDKIGFEHFKAWIQYNKEATILSKWLLTTSCVSLSSELETPTFYQTLAGVTHLEEQDICELEKCFWSLQSRAPSGQLDLACLMGLISPPVPTSACRGLFLALDVNRDGHIDFKELCCGISAACRGPTLERMKFCFKIFDTDRDNRLNADECRHMADILSFITREHTTLRRSRRGGGTGGATLHTAASAARRKNSCNSSSGHSTSSGLGSSASQQTITTSSNGGNSPSAIVTTITGTTTTGIGTTTTTTGIVTTGSSAGLTTTGLGTTTGSTTGLGMTGMQGGDCLEEGCGYGGGSVYVNRGYVPGTASLTSMASVGVSGTGSNNVSPTESLTQLWERLCGGMTSDDNSQSGSASSVTTEVGITLEEFLMWTVEGGEGAVGPLLELLFEVCHVALGLKPHCRHHEREIVLGWLERERSRGYRVGQYWYLISMDWWQSWLTYSSTPRSSSSDHSCSCRVSPPSPPSPMPADSNIPQLVLNHNNSASNNTSNCSVANSSNNSVANNASNGIVAGGNNSNTYNSIVAGGGASNSCYVNSSVSTSLARLGVEEGIVCDEGTFTGGALGLTGIGGIVGEYAHSGGEFTSTSTDSMGELLSRGDSCSIASSSGISSSSAGTAGGGGGKSRQQHSSPVAGGPPPPGPIDNTSLIAEPLFGAVATLTGEGGRLRPGTDPRRDCVPVPDGVWKALVLWYGVGGAASATLPRQVIRPSASSEPELELFPVNLRILRHHQPQIAPQVSRGGGRQPPSSNTSSSSGGGWTNVVGGFGAAALSGAPPPNSPNNSSHSNNSGTATPRRYLAHTAAFSRLSTIRQVAEFLAAPLALQCGTDDVRLWHVRGGSGSTNVSLGGGGGGIVPLLEEEEAATLEELGMVDGDQVLLEVRNRDLTWPEELGALASGAVNTGYSGGPLSVPGGDRRRPTISLPPGATGLHNLGNTCFMNSALQAVSNTRPLTQYFQRDAQLCELNSSNPLGSRGQVARRYAELVRELWSGSTRSVAPLKLRWCVTKHAPHLGGGGQHDSQELLAWLLDALHEDLNRVTSKQYTELRDSDGRPDVIVAEEGWRQHLARDHSIITDLFYGQLKSKVTCQTCGHESVRFDAFNLLSLPLPMESYTLCEVIVIKLDGSVPVKYGLRLNYEARYAELKHELQYICAVAAERILLAELESAQIRKVLADETRIDAKTATELVAYEVPAAFRRSQAVVIPTVEGVKPALQQDREEVTSYGVSTSLARSPEVRTSSALCMPNILCFKSLRNNSIDLSSATRRMSSGVAFNKNPLHSNVYTDVPMRAPTYLVALHRKCMRQESYFLSQHKSKPSLFGIPVLLGCDDTSTCQSLYESVWGQVTRLLSPLPQSDQTNHATDCDDSLGYEFPFTLKAVLQGGQICALCHWTNFCRGCDIPCGEDNLFQFCRGGQSIMCVAIDWDPTALHLRYQSSREKIWTVHESVETCRKLHTEPIDLDYCLKAFTSEERLEAKYHCSNCKDKQPATKKLQIWRLPPILIVHLKRFDYVNAKWVKTQKVVNFPFKNFDPTAYLASVPQETILRHKQLVDQQQQQQPSDCLNPNSNNNTTTTQQAMDKSNSNNEIHQQYGRIVEETTTTSDSQIVGRLIDFGDDETDATAKKVSENVFRKCEHLVESKVNQNERINEDNRVTVTENNEDCVVKQCERLSTSCSPKKPMLSKRTRLESTSLIKTPVMDEDLQDFHKHKLQDGQDPFDLKYQLYAVVSHSGLLSGGHYISYACNPNGHWYCYNDSTCREIPAEAPPQPPVLSDYLTSSRSRNVTPLPSRRVSSTTATTGVTTATITTVTTGNATATGATNAATTGATIGATTGATTAGTTGTATVTNQLGVSSGGGMKLGGDSGSGGVGGSLKVVTESRGTVKESNDCCDDDSSSTTSNKCPYSNVKPPRIDTSAAYILFYERSGLDYKPYLPDVAGGGGGGGGGHSSTSNNNSSCNNTAGGGDNASSVTLGNNSATATATGAASVPEVELEESETEIRKQFCRLQ